MPHYKSSMILVIRHHSASILQVRKTRDMKLFVVLAAVVSVALADECPPCPTPEETGASCRDFEMLCQRDPGPGAAACECPRSGNLLFCIIFAFCKKINL